MVDTRLLFPVAAYRAVIATRSDPARGKVDRCERGSARSAAYVIAALGVGAAAAARLIRAGKGELREEQRECLIPTAEAELVAGPFARALP
jgi:hypothetical protein